MNDAEFSYRISLLKNRLTSLRGKTMEESKTRKYILTEMNLPEFKQKSDAAYPGKANHIAWLDKNAIEGAFYAECLWFQEGSDTNRVEAHSHDFDEVIGFFGTNPEDQTDLGGEIELWLEDEKHIITKSFLAFVPKGMVHCPLKIKRVDRPIFHFTTGPGGSYIRKDLPGK
jgi:hypothetical protein